MNHRERLEQTLLACRDRIQEEVAALIGKPFRLGAPVFRLADAGTLTGEPAAAGRLFAPVRLDGEVAGMGLMLVRLGGAIRIGGLLVMLPEVELQGAVRAEAWSEEMADTFAEVAGIVCGALSAVFKEQFPRQVRFLAAGQQVVVAGDPVPPSSLATGEMFVLIEELLDQEDAVLLAGPLGRLLQNAIKHGLEAAADRERAGKAANGRLGLLALRRDGQLWVSVEDDGRGMDPRRIIGWAVARGLVDPDRAGALTSEEIVRLLLPPDGADDTGAAVPGLAAVKASLQPARGSIDIHSRPGKGTRITLKVPKDG